MKDMKISSNNYLSIGLSLIIVILLIYCLSLRNSRDNAVNRLDKANAQINNLININQSQSEAISQLKSEKEASREYISNLSAKYIDTTKLIDSLFTKFRVDRRTNQQLNDWANTRLPEGLY